jgi:cyclase
MISYRVLALAGAALLSGWAATAASAQAKPDLPTQPPQLPPGPLEVDAGSPYVIYPVRNNVYMITGPGANVGVQVGTDGVLVVDTGGAGASEGLLKQVRRLSRKPILYVLNTNADPDHIGSNTAISSSGVLLEGGNTRPKIVEGSDGAPIIASEGVMNRLTGAGITDGLPTQTFFVAQKDLFFNNEPISLIAAPGHTGGDSFVMFRRSDVIAAGDIYTPDRYPVIDTKNGGSITAYLASLNKLIDLTVSEFNQEGGTYVIPGHGRLSDEGDVADYRDMITWIRDRIKDMVDKKMTLAQVKAARPTFDYDPRFGAKAGDVLVEQIYTSLTSEGAQQ